MCGPALWRKGVDELHDHKGENFKRWRRAMAASVGGVLVDDIIDAE